MKFARIAVLAIAIIAGGMAALLVGGGDPPPAPQVVDQTPLAEVLVANADIAMGTAITDQMLSWREWPESGSAGFITKAAQPNAIEETKGAIARQPIAGGEPIRPQKIVKSDGSGFMAAILPAGMRAVAVEISAVTGAGGFILPNDRVDVILTRKSETAAAGSADGATSSTILNNVRVLAIDQAVSEQDGQKVVIGSTATLELLPRQTEILALARQLGTLSLSLRPLVDAKQNGLDGSAPVDMLGGGQGVSTQNITVIRYGVPSTSSER